MRSEDVVDELLDFNPADIPECGWDDIENILKFPGSEPEPETEKPKANKGRNLFPLYSLSDIREMEEPSSFLDGLIPEGAIAVLYGPSHSGKSFLALDWSLSCASGSDWLGREVKAGEVVYIYAENPAAMKKRVDAWCAAHDGEPERFYAVPASVMMTSPKDTNKLIETIEATGLAPALIVVDTLARCFAGNENSAEDMGAFVNGCTKVRDAFPGSTLLVVHHTGWVEGHERGSSSLHAAIDASLKLAKAEKSDSLTLSCAKAKDLEEFDDIPLKLKQVQLGKDAKGRRVSSCVVEMGDNRGQLHKDADAIVEVLGDRRMTFNRLFEECRDYEPNPIKSKGGRFQPALEWLVSGPEPRVGKDGSTYYRL